MSIEELLIDNRNKLDSYFSGDKDAWLNSYADSVKRIEHDEPWVTLVSIYALFGDFTTKIAQHRIEALNDLLKNSGMQNPPVITDVEKIKVERQFKEVLSYREYLHAIAKQNLIFHYYKDRIDKIKTKSEREKASFEGNTNVDLFIEARAGDRPLYLFIEAKFLSDISYQVSYSTVRDQISRNIDTGIEFISKEEELKGFDSLYFLMLTPRQFRTELYGGNGNPPLLDFHPERSRLYCYKMNEFKDYRMLKAALPHRGEIKDKDWRQISQNMGWITFEDMYQLADFHKTMDPAERSKIETFFKDRNLI